MLEEMFGMSYESLMKKIVFDALDIESAEFGYSLTQDVSQPYRHRYRDQNKIGIPLKENERVIDDIFNSAGNISLSIKDFAKFVLINKKILKGEETPFDNAIFKEMFEPVTKIENGNEIGLGWQIIYVNGIKTYGHSGSDKTIRAAMSINPQTNQAVVFATNIGDEFSEIAMLNVILELLNL